MNEAFRLRKFGDYLNYCTGIELTGGGLVKILFIIWSLVLASHNGFVVMEVNSNHKKPRRILY